MAENRALEILKLFGLSGEGIRLERLTQGYINDTFRVHTPKGNGFVVQRINGEVFPEAGRLIENLEAVLPFLRGPGYSELKLEKNLQGQTSVVDTGGSLWRVFQYIPDSVSFENVASTEMAAEAGRIVSAFHHLVSDISPKTLQVTLPRFHDLPLRQAQLEGAVSEAGEERLQNSTALLEQAKSLFGFCQDIPLAELPLRVCHNDTKLSNILFDADTAKALCLIDLDTLMPGHLLYDFGDAARGMLFSESGAPGEAEETAGNLQGGESEADKTHHRDPDWNLQGKGISASEAGKSLPSKAQADLHFFEAFVNGWKSSGLAMTPLEIEWLCHGVVLMPTLHAVRALTDYLSGDRYYKVAYPQQNLDRAGRLLHAAQTAQKALGAMQEITYKICGPQA
jgi:Ser/Thr protein kinase RdoA (MazF antagonist)